MLKGISSEFMWKEEKKSNKGKINIKLQLTPFGVTVELVLCYHQEQHSILGLQQGAKGSQTGHWSFEKIHRSLCQCRDQSTMRKELPWPS